MSEILAVCSAPSARIHVESWVCRRAPGVRKLGRQRQVDSWSSLAGWSHQTDEVQGQ